MVNHYQQWDETDKDTRHDFEVYNLDDYNEDLAQQHGLRHDNKSQWNVKHLQDITKDVIDSDYLDEKEYINKAIHKQACDNIKCRRLDV